MSVHFILYSRSWCHLCDDMLEALQRQCQGRDTTVEVIDIDQDAQLLAKYDELVPVLYGRKVPGQAQRLCHYFLDTQAVDAFLAG